MFTTIRERLEDREDGFTLIELLVVVIIIGILAAIAIPAFLNQRQRGYAAEAESNARNAGLMEESYYTEFDAYTAAPDDLKDQGYTGGPVTITLYNSAGADTSATPANAVSFCVESTVEGQTAGYDSATGGLVADCP